MKTGRFEKLTAESKAAKLSLAEKTQECGKLRKEVLQRRAEEERLSNFNARVQLEVHQLEAQRDVLIAALADAQRRLQVLRTKTRPCGCGLGVSEDADVSGMTLTDRAAEVLA